MTRIRTIATGSKAWCARGQAQCHDIEVQNPFVERKRLTHNKISFPLKDVSQFRHSSNQRPVSHG